MRAFFHSGAIRRTMRALASDERGVTALIFALVAMPTVIAVGAAVDYSRAARLQSKLQTATDAAVLAAGGSVAERSDDELRAAVTKEFNALMAGESGNPRIDSAMPIAISAGRTRLEIYTKVDFQPLVLRTFQQTAITAAAATEVSNLNYEIALVFDNSGSMGESAGGKSKMDAAKTAAKSLVDIMYSTDRSAARTKIALVPFTITVNAGSGYAGASWADTTGKSSIHWENFDRATSSFKPMSRFDVYQEMGVNWAGCFEARPGIYGLNDSPGSDANAESLFVPMLAPDEYDGSGGNSYLNEDTDGVCTKAERNISDWKGRQSLLCKYKNSKNRANKIGASAASGPNWQCNAKPIMRLTKSKDDLKTAVNNMVASGNTNILEGFMWGWRAISPNNPFADGQSYEDDKTQKIIILMTDGENVWNSASNNNKSVYSSFGYYINNRIGNFTTQSSAEAAMDAKTRVACTNAKAAGVRVYTVGFSVKTGDVNTQLLKDCATSATTAYIAKSASQIDAVFKEIAASIGQLRLTH